MGQKKPELVINVSPVTDIKDLDKPKIIINLVYDPKSTGLERFELGEFILQIIPGIRLAPKFV